MILCSCTVIDSAALAQTVRDILHDDPYAVITPGRLFHRLGRRMKCARCVTLMDAKIAEELVRYGRTQPHNTNAKDRK